MVAALCKTRLDLGNWVKKVSSQLLAHIRSPWLPYHNPTEPN